MDMPKKKLGKVTFESTLKRFRTLPQPEKMSDDDRKFYSEIGEALMRNELELLMANKQWVLGVISLASMLDFVGKTKLIWKHKGSISSRKIFKYKFYETIKDLFDTKIIDSQTFRKMEEIREMRNKFAHDLLRLLSRSHEPNSYLENLIREGITTIETLFLRK